MSNLYSTPHLQSDCHHRPSKLEKLRLFLAFLLYRNTLYDTKTGTARCVDCDVLLLAPIKYEQIAVRGLYLLASELSFFVGIRIGLVLAQKYSITWILCVVLIFLVWVFGCFCFDRIITAAIFTWYPWRDAEIDHSKEQLHREGLEAYWKEYRMRLYSMFRIGAFLMITLVGRINLTYFVALPALALMGLSIVQKNKRNFSISIIILAYAIFSVLCILYVQQDIVTLLIECISIIIMSGSYLLLDRMT